MFIARREIGGRALRQLGQVRKEAAVTNSVRVVGLLLFRSAVLR